MTTRIFKSKIALALIVPAFAMTAASEASDSGFSISNVGTWSEFYNMLFGRGHDLNDIGGPVIIPDSIGGPVVIPDNIGGPVVIPDSLGGR